jgi:copper chaperone CopZ
MKLRYLFTLALLVAFTFTACKEEMKKVEKQEAPQELAEAKMETVSLNISGMSCEIGCAKTIQSKLSKKDGVAEAKVIFADSIATVEFDANKTSSEDLITFINGIAGGDLYTASELASGEK